MADKETTLAIVLRTVDKATGGLRAFNERIKAIGVGLHVLTAPARLLGEKLAGLAKEAGLPRLIDGFKGVGGAVKDLFGKLLGLGGVAGVAVLGLMHLVAEFDDLGDKADQLGVHVDFLAQLRYAAERAGASAEQLDGGLQTLSQSMGQLRAGTGRMKAFLDTVSPALGKQLKATQSNEEAFLLLADAMALLPTDKAAALTQKAFGDSALAPLLRKGSKGVAELMQRYSELAGSQQDAAEGAGAVDDALKDLKASTDGVKAAIVKGLSPALKIIVDKLSEWFTAHRADIERWATDIGQKLPGAIEKVVVWIGKAFDKVTEILDRIGGLKVAFAAVAAVMAGPLISAFATLGAAMLATPFGALLVSLGAVLAMSVSINREIEKFSDALDTSNEKQLQDLGSLNRGELTQEQFDARNPGFSAHVAAQGADEDSLIAGRMTPQEFEAKHPGVKADFLLDEARRLGRAPSFLTPRGTPRDMQMDFGLGSPTPVPAEVRLKIDFANAPKGMRATTDPQNKVDVDVMVGYALGFLP